MCFLDSVYKTFVISTIVDFVIQIVHLRVYKTFVMLVDWEKYCTFAIQIFEQFTIRIIP